MKTVYDVLDEHGVIPRRERNGQARMSILKCIGCRLAYSNNQANDPEVAITLSDVETCSGFAKSGLDYAIKRLERARVIKSETRRNVQPGRSAIYYTLADSPVGDTLREIMSAEPPEVCPLLMATDEVETEVSIATEAPLPDMA